MKPGIEFGGKGLFAEAFVQPFIEVAQGSCVKVVRSPEMRARLASQGWQAVGSSPEGLALRMRQDVAALGRIIREQGIRAP
jgi:tripartite-type tricarboxylate transporter receptor subunit TctC